MVILCKPQMMSDGRFLCIYAEGFEDASLWQGRACFWWKRTDSVQKCRSDDGGGRNQFMKHDGKEGFSQNDYVQ